MNALSEKQSEWLEKIWDSLEKKITAECERVGTDIPFIPYQGRYIDCMMPGGLSWWTNGFWPGILWQMYYATGKEIFRETAHGVDERMAAVLADFENLDHDIGFLFLPGIVAEYRLTGDESCRSRGIHAANLLAGRFNSKGQFIRAWNKSMGGEDVPGWMIIDCLLNIPLLFWAGNELKDPRFTAIAEQHAQTALHRLLRPDGSCSHIVSFDPSSGAFLGSLGGQGYGEGSSWSRGQGWAVYGFALAYRNTGNPEYLEAAKRSAHYCISAMSVTDWLPRVDFRAPMEKVARYDSGAGVIIACGLLELSEHVPELEQGIYRDAAFRILQACEERFANMDPDTDGILFGGSVMYHNDPLADQAFIYNDYFFLEAILRLRGRYLMIWGADEI